ncbi:hyptothetic protein [Streptococcus pneumoniae]|nr:hyptothetic protein [Streptococcus pneumoniae]VMN59248.1 hyptothetic protein [Streptococcus pneumoniae]VOA15957.1 hyptothetic protein [Streptococcus pneumoniae]VQB26218.1 hyptothetic protein [Streptococcus pneumoniae]VTD20080.1 hyptothetic protein [Streptococcus pneumoniae]
MQTITKYELQRMGFGPSQSADIVRRAKLYLVKKGYGYYSSKRLGRVPLSSVEHILGFPIDTKELEEKNHA